MLNDWTTVYCFSNNCAFRIAEHLFVITVCIYNKVGYLQLSLDNIHKSVVGLGKYCGNLMDDFRYKNKSTSGCVHANTVIDETMKCIHSFLIFLIYD